MRTGGYLKATTSMRGAEVVMTLAGPIDESTEQALATALAAVKNPSFCVDCEAITTVNSIGSRHFMVAFEQVTATHQVRFERCSPVFVSYCSLILGFIGQGEIASLFLPYFCQACSSSHRQLIDAASFRAEPRCPAVDCPTCRRPMRSDMNADELIDILESRP